MQVAWQIGDRLNKLSELLPATDYLHVLNEAVPLGVRGVVASRFVGLRKEHPTSVDARYESVTQALQGARSGIRYPRWSFRRNLEYAKRKERDLRVGGPCG